MEEITTQEATRRIASFEALQQRGSSVSARWLSELDDTNGLLEALGGDAAVIGYSDADFTIFTDHVKFGPGETQVPDTPLARLHQFCFVLRSGPGKEFPHVFPCGPIAYQWISANLSPHVIDQVIRISDDLAGWKRDFDPFGKRRGDGAKPSSAGGASPDSDGDSGS